MKEKGSHETNKNIRLDQGQNQGTTFKTNNTKRGENFKAEKRSCGTEHASFNRTEGQQLKKSKRVPFMS
jgi:hypothetical protein